MTENTLSWQDFLVRHGAQLNPATQAIDGFEPAETSAASVAPRQAPAAFVTPLTDVGLIAVSGEEGASFLHTQLTNDVEHLTESDVRLAGYCTPKGRLLATMLIWKSDEAVWLQLPRELQPAIQKRLEMFRMRAKAPIHDLSDQYAVLGVSLPPDSNALTHWFETVPDAPYAKVESPAGTLLRLPDVQGSVRFQIVVPVAQAQEIWPLLTRDLPAVGAGFWQLSEVRSGIPQVTLATQEKFVPQMINYEAVGGVNFKKGCFPGQEIVARSQYLGKLKRRMQHAQVADASAAAGMEVFSSTDPGQPCGMVVNAAPRPDGQGAECLVEIKMAALDEGSVHLGSASGPQLDFLPLPYALPDPD